MGNILLYNLNHRTKCSSAYFESDREESEACWNRAEKHHAGAHERRRASEAIMKHDGNAQNGCQKNACREVNACSADCAIASHEHETDGTDDPESQRTRAEHENCECM